MATLTCNSCNLSFQDEGLRGLHYRSDWHCYNLKRKIAGLPGVTEAWYEKRREALAAESTNSKDGPRMLYQCTLCGKDYSSINAHANHLLSRLHIQNAGAAPSELVDNAAVFTAPAREEEEETEGGEWEEVEDTDGSVSQIEQEREAGDSMADDWEIDRCFICDKWHGESIESCVEHMHLVHGFFIPDADFLKDPAGLLRYLRLKVAQGHLCLYCDRQFRSSEAVRKHMADKSHCKLRYGDGTGLSEEELEDFYEFSMSSGDEQEEWQVVDGQTEQQTHVSLSSTGAELLVGSGPDAGNVPKLIGSRDLARYYRQQPRPSEAREGVLANSIAARYRSMGLSTKQGGWHGKVAKYQDNGAKTAARAESERSAQGIRNNKLHGLSSSSAQWGR